MYHFLHFLFVTYRTTSFSALFGYWTTVTYDSLSYGNVNNGMVDIGTGIFNVQVPGDYEFHYQGRDVRVLLLFTGYFFVRV